SRNKKTNTPFRRVKAEEIEVDPRLKDNSFLAKGGAQGSYGHKANMELMPTRGKAFTKEKNKKKRGSYRGGIIDTGVHSIKFD
ncbi:SRP40, C-terminal domain-containing protein, partial [Phakopsora pachyrhizi]